MLLEHEEPSSQIFGVWRHLGTTNTHFPDQFYHSGKGQLVEIAGTPSTLYSGSLLTLNDSKCLYVFDMLTNQFTCVWTHYTHSMRYMDRPYGGMLSNNA